LEPEDRSERAILFGPIYSDSPVRNDSILDELGRLVEAAGGIPVGRITQSLHKPTPATFFGSGKIEALKQLVLETEADVAVFDEELTPAQGRNLERILCIRVIDRSELILDIFAHRAKSHQARLQVALAQLQYKLPRLRRMWTHLDRIKSAIGARGPGETQIESDRRLIRDKIQEYRQKLKSISDITQRTIQSRQDFKVSLVGYTNAGKSTLMRHLTDPDVYVADQLFATLDTLTRRFKVPDAGHCLLSDTVGFVDKLPHHLVTSFHATLSEAREADLLLHVVDSADPLLMQHVDTVERVLSGIGCGDLPTIVIANKMDKEGALIGLQDLKSRFPDVMAVSAIGGHGLEPLLEAISQDMREAWEELELTIPWKHGQLIAILGNETRIIKEEYTDEGMILHCQAPGYLVRQHQLHDFVLSTNHDVQSPIL
jgi:GTP-binding protein HflX